MNWTSAVLGGIGLWDQLDRYDDMGNYIESELDDARVDAVENSRFRPFTVTGRGGGASLGPNGGVQMNPSAQAQATSDARAGQSNDFYNRAANNVGANTQDAFERMRAMQMPGEQRQMQAMEARAQAQGRLGISGSNYGGGTPEMLAMQQAIQEGRNTAAVQAMQFGQQQQAQDAALAGQFQQAEYMPQAQTMNLLNQGLQGARLNQAGQLAGMNYDANLRLGQVQSQVNSEQIRAQLMGGLFQTVGGMASANQFDPLGDIASSFGEWFRNII